METILLMIAIIIAVVAMVFAFFAYNIAKICSDGIEMFLQMERNMNEELEKSIDRMGKGGGK